MKAIKVVYSDRGRRYSHPVLYELDGNTINFKFNYNKHIVEEIKALEGARWYPELKMWTATLSVRNLTALEIMQGDYTIYEWYSLPLIKEFNSFDFQLFDHQKIGVKWILTKKKCLIAGEPGVGKSLIALVALKNTTCTHPLIVAPLCAIQQWKRELVKWKIYEYPWRFINYESVQKITEEIKRGYYNIDFLILDESVKIKNPATERAKKVNELIDVSKPEYIVPLSGVPAPRDPGDWWNQLEVCCPNFIREGSPQKLRKRLGQWEKTGEYETLEVWKDDEIAKFAKRISPIVFSIKKSDVFDFPDKIFDPIDIPVSEEYKKLSKFWVYNEPKPIVLLTRLREVSDGFSIVPCEGGEIKTVNGEFTLQDIPNSPKELLLRELLEFYEDTGRIVISAAFRQSIDKVMRVCKAMGWEVGLSAKGIKPEISFLNRFASDEPNKLAAVVHPQCVYGLNLSASPAILVYSNDFNADSRAQLLERCDRPGKKGAGTRIVDFLHLNSDQHVLSNLDTKLGIHNFTVEQIRLWFEES